MKRDLIGNGDAVLLVDDIVTTGATVRQCVQAFQQAGTKVVGVLVLADAVVRRSETISTVNDRSVTMPQIAGEAPLLGM